MTLDDIQTAKSALEAEGIRPSYNAILTRLGHGSKRDVAHLLRVQAADVPVPALGEEPPLPAPPGPPLPAPPEPPLPDEPPLPPAASPLHQGRQARDATAAAEQALGEQEQALKQQRKALEAQVQEAEHHAARQTSDVVDLACRQRLRAVRSQLEQVEAQRLEVHRRRRAGFEMKLAAQDDYNALQGQTARWLRRLRQAQRAALASASAYQRGEAAEEFEEALQHLTALVGVQEAQRCATDQQYQPAWLRE